MVMQSKVNEEELAKEHDKTEAMKQQLEQEKLLLKGKSMKERIMLLKDLQTQKEREM